MTTHSTATFAAQSEGQLRVLHASWDPYSAYLVTLTIATALSPRYGRRSKRSPRRPFKTRSIARTAFRRAGL